MPGAQSRPPARFDVNLNVAGGEPLRVRIRNNGFDYEVIEEIFLKGVYKVQVQQVRRILDLGGNIGAASLFLSKSYPDAQICVVEPSAANLELLQHNLTTNRVPFRVVKGAAGGEDGKIRFQLSGDPRQDYCETAQPGSVAPEGSVEVDLYSVPSLMKLMAWEGIDLMKIDIEGSEVQVLGGRPEWLRKVRAIVGEGHDGAHYSIEACRHDLEPMGFRVQLLDKREGAAIVFFAQQRN